MTTGRKKPVKHTKERVLRITFINLVLFLSIYSIYSLFYVLITQGGLKFIPETVSLSVLLIVFACLMFYGGGIYVTSILLEDFTLPDLRSVPHFKTQFIETMKKEIVSEIQLSYKKEKISERRLKRDEI